MRDLTREILEHIRRTFSSLPGDVEDRLQVAVEMEEPGSAARGALETLLKLRMCKVYLEPISGRSSESRKL
jgi:hypothetical protein